MLRLSCEINDDPEMEEILDERKYELDRFESRIIDEMNISRRKHERDAEKIEKELYILRHKKRAMTKIENSSETFVRGDSHHHAERRSERLLLFSTYI